MTPLLWKTLAAGALAVAGFVMISSMLDVAPPWVVALLFGILLAVIAVLIAALR